LDLGLPARWSRSADASDDGGRPEFEEFSLSLASRASSRRRNATISTRWAAFSASSSAIRSASRGSLTPRVDHAQIAKSIAISEVIGMIQFLFLDGSVPGP
jgi:hypothetical protein